jgi:hypothetical protein
MYNSRTKSTLLPRSAARKTNNFPSSLSMVAVRKNRSSFYFLVLAVGSFTSLITFRGTLFVPYYAATLHSIRSVHFTHLSTAQLREILISISQAPFIPFPPSPFPTQFQWSIFHTAASPPQQAPFRQSGKFITPNR